MLLVNLGTPDEATPAAVRRYLAEFLSDPRVIEVSPLVWWPLLHGVILRTRPAKSAVRYKSVWLPEGSPLAVWTERQAAALRTALAARGHEVLVRIAMRYGRPSIPATMDSLRAEGATRVLVLPLYPQYAAATTASVCDEVMHWARSCRRMPELRFAGAYHDDPGYINALAASVRERWASHGRPERLVVSFHGLRQQSLTQGDPYHCQCHKTARLLGGALGLEEGMLKVAFQSRVGRARWLEPYTESVLRALAAQGVKRVDVLCPGFAVDCLETLEEIAHEARAAFLGAGGEVFGYIECLNARPDWIGALTDLALRQLQGWPINLAKDSGACVQQRERAMAMGATE